jgi:hypothetical protein
MLLAERNILQSLNSSIFIRKFSFTDTYNLWSCLTFPSDSDIEIGVRATMPGGVKITVGETETETETEKIVTSTWSGRGLTIAVTKAIDIAGDRRAEIASATGKMQAPEIGTTLAGPDTRGISTEGVGMVGVGTEKMRRLTAVQVQRPMRLPGMYLMAAAIVTETGAIRTEIKSASVAPGSTAGREGSAVDEADTEITMMSAGVTGVTIAEAVGWDAGTASGAEVVAGVAGPVEAVSGSGTYMLRVRVRVRALEHSLGENLVSSGDPCGEDPEHFPSSRLGHPYHLMPMANLFPTRGFLLVIIIINSTNRNSNMHRA